MRLLQQSLLLDRETYCLQLLLGHIGSINVQTTDVTLSEVKNKFLLVIWYFRGMLIKLACLRLLFADVKLPILNILVIIPYRFYM